MTDETKAMYRAGWDNNLDQWCVYRHEREGELGGIVARGMPDRLTAEDVAEAMQLSVDHAASTIKRAPINADQFRL